VLAYRSILTGLARWLAKRKAPIVRASRVDLQDFIASRVRGGWRPGSAAGQLTSFRQFFRYLVREGVIDEDPRKSPCRRSCAPCRTR
jgi:integrase/recombinase XerD